MATFDRSRGASGRPCGFGLSIGIVFVAVLALTAQSLTARGPQAASSAQRPPATAAAAPYQFMTSGSEVDTKAQALLARMNLDEKIGQMTQVDLLALKDPADLARLSIGSVLSGGDSDPKDITPKGWADTYDELQAAALKSRLKIPIIYGIDAVHGHNNVKGAVLFPHNIGLGATRNPALVERVARSTAEEIAATGIDWTFAPGVIVGRDERWGRTYESFSEDPAVVAELGAAAIRGLQGPRLNGPTSILACAKHYLGDGGTTGGKDQGNTEVDDATMRRLFLPPYAAAVKAGAGSIMVSFNSWNGQKLHGHKYLLTDVLKGELGFKGFLVSDWAAIDQLGPDFKADIEKSINAGLDMVMIPNGPDKPNNYVEFITKLRELVTAGRVPQARIDDAVRRILRIKIEMGLFERPYTDKALTPTVGSTVHREVARQAVRESLVLLKNDKNVLPLSKNLKRVHVSGQAADELSMQSGGWTVDWQGTKASLTTGATTVLKAVQIALAGKSVVTSNTDASPAGSSAVIVVLGEQPYAEGVGDRADLSIPQHQIDSLKEAKAQGVPVILVLFSGRPIILGEAWDLADAIVAAWLPGSEAQGITDVLFGDFAPKGKLPMSWPRSMVQIPINVGDPKYDPQFPFGFGLTYQNAGQR